MFLDKVDKLKKWAEKNADRSVTEKRRSICKACPHYFGITGQCNICGCFIRLKSTLKNQSCPINKW